MQKKFLALAVAGALAPAAAMAQSTVEIYGRANLGIDTYSATGSTADTGNFKSRARVFDSSSRVGFRVNESLGGGMRAFVVVETGVNIDSGSQNGQAGVGGVNGSSGFWASRSSYLGLGGGWGDIRFGRQDVFYGNGIIQQAAANYINTAVDGIWTQLGNGISAPGGRLSNVLSYNSPTMGGFNASVYWSPNSEGSNYTGAGQSKDSVWALTARYSGGPLRAQFDILKRDNVGFVSDNEDLGWKIGVGWAYAPDSQISVVTGKIENERVGADNDPEIRITTFNWEHMLGQWQLIAQYMVTSDIKNIAVTDNTATKGYTLAAKYFMSKRTGVYASFSQYKNESNAFADFGPGACLSSGPACHLAAGSAGADPRIIALGIMHNF